MPPSPSRWTWASNWSWTTTPCWTPALRQIVFVDKGDGRLEPREVVVGDRADGLAIIVKGLEAGEKVVTSGNFLVDSESRMKAALRQVGGASRLRRKRSRAARNTNPQCRPCRACRSRL